ncbi:nuclear transport factor 2 family protein [Nocardioides sp. NPDC051685]|uniref:nuclear transport factor 2 family protein n=1 Tax=Nocardioides sp. NPDC051685 TaxID=3364334 RepID=UPI0037BC4404
MDLTTRLTAVEDIRLMKARYFRGVDEHDWGLLGSVLTEDVVCDFRGAMMGPRGRCRR